MTSIDGHATRTVSGRKSLPQLSGTGLFVTDGGLETELIFHHGLDLPCFAAFPLLENPDTCARLRRYYDGYLAIARDHGAGFVIETPTWRANPDWAGQLGYSPEQLDAANRAAVSLAEEVRAVAAADGITAVVSGCVGPRGDGYDPGIAMTPEEAERYHSVQIGTFATTSADQVTAITMTNAEEAIGIVRAASAAGIPAAISFTVETDGRLPTGQPLHEAIEQVDAATGASAAYFMVNCAHPTHFADALAPDGAWRRRLVGLRANASMRSHAELDEATELDEGDPVDLGARHAALRDRLPAVTVLGGCCGTDARHVAAIVSAWRAY
jgi:S-methylmethionine-dependent homocysteine/selenocysteine methylase